MSDAGRVIRSIAAAIRRPTEPPERAGLDWSAIYPSGPAPATIAPGRPAAAIRAIPASTSPVQLAPANPRRRQLTLVNDSTATLYVLQGPSAAPIAGGYTVALGAAATYIIEPPDPYQGELSGVWSAVNGAAAVTEQ